MNDTWLSDRIITLKSFVMYEFYGLFPVLILAPNPVCSQEMCLYHCWFEEAYTEDTSRSNTLKMLHSGDVDGDPDDSSAGQLNGLGGKGLSKGTGGPIPPTNSHPKPKKEPKPKTQQQLARVASCLNFSIRPCTYNIDM